MRKVGPDVLCAAAELGAGDAGDGPFLGGEGEGCEGDEEEEEGEEDGGEDGAAAAGAHGGGGRRDLVVGRRGLAC